MPVAMALIDREGREVAVNQEWRMIYSLNNSDVKGRKVTDFCEKSENILSVISGYLMQD